MNIPEGFALVPKSMHLDKEIIHAINFHCGDGESGNYGAFADGSLWIGVITDDDGKEVHGLHIATAEYPEEGSTTLVEFPAAIAQPAAHLTITGALEWDGDNGTHGVVGTHGADSAHSESAYDDANEACAEVERAGAPGDVIREMNDELVDLRAQLDESNVVRHLIQAWASAHGRPVPWAKAIEITAVATKMPEDEKAALLALDDEPEAQYTAVDMTTAAAGGFRDGQAELYAVLNQAYMALIGYLPGHRNDLTDAAIAACGAILFPVEAKAACSRCGDWGHIETEDSAHDCPE